MHGKVETAPIPTHGAAHLPKVTVDTYNAALRKGGGYIGDRANKRAFAVILEEWRERLRRVDKDPLGGTPSHDISKKKLDMILAEGESDAAGLIQGAIEDFARSLAGVLHCLLKLKGWRRTERIVVGGGFRDSRIGEVAIGRAGVLLQAAGIAIDLLPIRHDPDEAGLIGAVHLVPSWMFSGEDAILAVDIGGSNMRAGIVAPRARKRGDLSKAEILRADSWEYGEEKPTRRKAVERLVAMLNGLIKEAAREKQKLLPFIGVGCPGLIRKDGSIARGGQNLPGNWEKRHFALPQMLREGVDHIDGHEPTILMHNDAVLQGLSELPFMQEVERWGVLTIGTGLGNARFTNRKPEEK